MAGRPSWSTVTDEKIDYRVPEKLNALTAVMATVLLEVFPEWQEPECG